MSREHQRLSPHRSKNGKWWWYEGGGGIIVLHQATDSRGWATPVEETKISWGAVRAALERKDRKDTP